MTFLWTTPSSFAGVGVSASEIDLSWGASTYISPYALLLHLDGSYTDTGANAITFSGSAAGGFTAAGVSPFGGTHKSANFTNSFNAYPYTAMVAALDYRSSAGTFALDCWFNATQVTTQQIIWEINDTAAGHLGGGTFSGMRAYILNGGIAMQNAWGGGNVTIPNSSVSASAWHHFATVMDYTNNAVRMYLDGGLLGFDIIPMTGQPAIAGNYFNVGGQSNNAQSINWSGDIAEVRLIRSDPYNPNFTPSASAFVSDSNTITLLHFDGTAGSTTFTDSGPNTLSYSAVGTAVLETTTTQFGTAALNPAATNNSWAQTPHNTLFDLTTGDFTIEAWIYTNTTGPYTIGFGSAPSQFPFMLGLNGVGGLLQFQGTQGGGSAAYVVTDRSGSGIPSNTWTHIAGVRNGNSFLLFKNGILVGVKVFTGTLDASLSTAGHGFSVGQGTSGTYYIDEVRVSNIARYTSNFTVPAAPATDNGATWGGDYNVTRAAASIATPAALLYNDTGLSPATSYLYTVAAWDSVGMVEVSAEASGTFSTLNTAANFSTDGFSDSVIFGSFFGGKLEMNEFTYYPMRPVFDDGTLGSAVPNMIINRYKQQPTDVRVRGVDFTLFCEQGENLVNVAVNTISPATTPPLVVTNLLIDPATQQKMAYTVSGGVDGTEYSVTFTATFNTGNVLFETVIFDVNLLVEAQFP